MVETTGRQNAAFKQPLLYLETGLQREFVVAPLEI